MQAWLIALLIQGVSFVALVWLYYVIVYKGSQLLGRFIPEGKLKNALFRERGSTSASSSTNARDQASGSADNLSALPGRDSRKNLGGPGGV